MSDPLSPAEHCASIGNRLAAYQACRIFSDECCRHASAMTAGLAFTQPTERTVGGLEIALARLPLPVNAGYRGARRRGRHAAGTSKSVEAFGSSTLSWPLGVIYLIDVYAKAKRRTRTVCEGRVKSTACRPAALGSGRVSRLGAPCAASSEALRALRGVKSSCELPHDGAGRVTFAKLRHRLGLSQKRLRACDFGLDVTARYMPW